MLSNITIAGTIFAAATCIALAVLSSVLAYKYRGNAGGAFMAFVFGFAGVIVMGSVSSILFNVTGLAALTAKEDVASITIAFVLYAVIYTGVSFGIRYYLLYYLDRTGIGKHKSFSLSGGMALGCTLPYVFNLLMRVLYAFAIKSGNFVNESMAGQEGYEEALAYQEAFIAAPKHQYYVFALQFIALCAFQLVVTMYMTRRWLENEKKVSSFVVLGASFLFEGARQLINGLASGKDAVITESTGFILCALVYVIVISASAYAYLKIMKDFPHGREKFIKPASQVKEDMAAKKKRLEWQQVQMLNNKNAAEEENND